MEVDYIQKYLDFYPSVDLLVSRINVQLPHFFANWPDPKAEEMKKMLCFMA